MIKANNNFVVEPLRKLPFRIRKYLKSYSVRFAKVDMVGVSKDFVYPPPCFAESCPSSEEQSIHPLSLARIGRNFSYSSVLLCNVLPSALVLLPQIFR